MKRLLSAPGEILTMQAARSGLAETFVKDLTRFGPAPGLAFFNLVAFTYYTTGTGIRQQNMERHLNLVPGAWPVPSMLTSPFFHTNALSFLFNTAVLLAAGKAMPRLPLFGYLALGAGSSLVCALQMRGDNS